MPHAGRLFATLTLALTVLSPPNLQAQERFTIEQILSNAFPSGLVAAPSGGSLAWVLNSEGRRNIWVAEAPAYEGRQLTAYAVDDGQEVSSLRFTPAGDQIVFVRGGAPNRQGEIPNPLSEPETTERALWIVSTTGGEPRRLVEGYSPSIAPDGSSVAFLRRGQVWSKLLASDEDASQLFAIRGGAGSTRWSPDGSKLAFVSGRGDHSFVGVYDIGDNRIAYIDPSVDNDGEPVWAPDGRRLAFVRAPRERGALPFIPRRSGEPWSILVADVESGETEIAWTADEGPGSVPREIVAENQLFWGAGDRIVFPWEKDGWTHLYSIDAGGGDPMLLTPGEFEVEHVTLSPDGREMLYSSNQDDIDRRHVWRVPVTGGTPRAVTAGQGNEWSPVFTSDREAIGILASDARHPAHAGIVIGSDHPRALTAAPFPDGYPTQELVEPSQVVFSAADGMPIHGQLFLPPNMRDGTQYPAVLFFHGGSRRQMLLGFHYSSYYHNAYALNQFLASRGYIVMSVNFRSGIGYGMEFREALDYGARGASEFNDVLGAGLYLRSRPDVDPDRIGLWGGSYGGYLTALGLARASDLFAAGVDLHGVHDWNVVIRNFVPSYDAAAREEVARLAFQSSPMAYLDGWKSPVLLIHGDDDRNVPFSETVDIVGSLRKQGVEFEQLIFPDEVHGFLLHKNWVAAYRAAADFFDRHLKER